MLIPSTKKGVRSDMWPDNTDRWFREISPYNRHRMRLRKGKACLLVIDMQNEFLDEEGAVFFHYATEILPNVKRMLAAARRASIPVIYTAHVHEDPDIDGGMTAEWWPEIKRGESLIAGTRGVEIHPELKPRKGEKIVTKHRYSAFYNTDLEIALRGMGITDLIIAGVLTNVCCESTARDAFFRDFRVFFLADATASSEPEFHVATLKNLAYAFAHIARTDEILRQMKP
jgi:ureidoacrylate peracid hydrolase